MLYALAPKAVDQILHMAYKVFPESSAAKGDKEGEDAPPARRPRSRTSCAACTGRRYGCRAGSVALRQRVLTRIPRRMPVQAAGEGGAGGCGMTGRGHVPPGAVDVQRPR